MVESEESRRIRRLLAQAQEGAGEGAEELAELVLGELHGLACRFMADQRNGHTLQPTALVNEAWLRMAGGAVPEGRARFLRVAAAAMRSILVDHARRRGAQKRGDGGRRVPLEDVLDRGVEDDGGTVIALHEELERLSEGDPAAAEVAEMRLFGGMENREIAGVLGVSPRTVDRLWSNARVRLQREFGI